MNDFNLKNIEISNVFWKLLFLYILKYALPCTNQLLRLIFLKIRIKCMDAFSILALKDNKRNLKVMKSDIQWKVLLVDRASCKCTVSIFVVSMLYCTQILYLETKIGWPYRYLLDAIRTVLKIVISFRFLFSFEIE